MLLRHLPETNAAYQKKNCKVSMCCRLIPKTNGDKADVQPPSVHLKAAILLLLTFRLDDVGQARHFSAVCVKLSMCFKALRRPQGSTHGTVMDVG